MLPQRLPQWVKVKLPGAGEYAHLRQQFGDLGLNTVCEEARCPNIAECWGGGTATFMILGKVCTRGCRFCEVISGKPVGLPDPAEPAHVARAVRAMKLKYAVVTSVDRDDLPDGGAAHFVATVQAIKEANPHCMIELLTPDFVGDAVAINAVAASGAEVFAHNVETVRRLTREIRDARCDFDLSLNVLAQYRRARPDALIKSSLMLGVGETLPEVHDALRDLRSVGVDWVTIGQYLRPSRKHLAVKEYIEPQQFDRLAEVGKSLGFAIVNTGPLVRSSYRAGEQDAQSLILARRQNAPSAVNFAQ